MPEKTNSIHVENVEWYSIFPFLRLFGSFRLAIQPAKMLLALLLVVLLYLGGQAMDFIWGPQVQVGEVIHYIHQPSKEFESWLDRPNKMYARSDVKSNEMAIAVYGENAESQGIFETTKNLEIRAFNQLISSAVAFHFGVGDFLTGQKPVDTGVVGALQVMVVVVPGWLYSAHPSFLAVYLLLAFLLLALIGGAIARLSAVHAGAGHATHGGAALAFTARRYVWFVLTPLIPLVIALLIGLLLAAFGALFFNFPVGDVIGAALFGLMLVGGFVITVLLIAMAMGINLFYPALAVEGTDAFDVISRVFNYALGRPWRYLFYTGVTIVYGAITYLFVGMVIFLVLAITRTFVGWWNVADLTAGVTRFNAILPPPQFGQLLQPMNWKVLQSDGSATVAAWVVLVWVKLLIALLPAYAVSFYFSAHTWIYLLLRQVCDDTEFQQIAAEEKTVKAHSSLMPDKLEPRA